MKYMLDTHSFLWALFDDKKLSGKAWEIIKNPDNDIYLSAIVYWEISLKYSMGKLELEGVTPEELPEIAWETGIETLGLADKETSSFYKLPRIKHKDPFDRMMVWQAIKRDIPLISKDKDLSAYKQFGLKLIWK